MSPVKRALSSRSHPDYSREGALELSTAWRYLPIPNSFKLILRLTDLNSLLIIKDGSRRIVLNWTGKMTIVDLD